MRKKNETEEAAHSPLYDVRTELRADREDKVGHFFSVLATEFLRLSPVQQPYPQLANTTQQQSRRAR